MIAPNPDRPLLTRLLKNAEERRKRWREAGARILDDGHARHWQWFAARIEEGWTLREMAAEVGVSFQRVSQILKEKGIKPNGRGGRKKEGTT